MPASAPFYLWVETEGFGGLPNTQQVKYDLLHSEIESLLKKGQTCWSYRILEVTWCEAAGVSAVSSGTFLIKTIYKKIKEETKQNRTLKVLFILLILLESQKLMSCSNWGFTQLLHDSSKCKSKECAALKQH